MTIWVARAGKNGEQEDRALEEGRAFIGWDGLGDLSQYGTRAKIRERLQKRDSVTYPDTKSGSARLSRHAGQIFKFFKDFKIDDWFALPLKKRPAIAFGKVAGDYEFIADNPERARHSRRIKWIGEPIPKSVFDEDIQKFFKKRPTVFRVGKNEAEEERVVERVVKVIDIIDIIGIIDNYRHYRYHR